MSIPMDSVALCDAGPLDAAPNRVSGGWSAQADDAVVARAQTGNGQAFDELVRRYRNEVFAFAYHLVHNREEAWDLSQEVFIKAHKGLKRFRGDCSFKTWLMRIVSNTCKDFFKRRRLPTTPFVDSVGLERTPTPTPDPRQALENREIGQAILSALDTLSYKHRTAFVLRELEGLSYSEMAEIMGCSLGTVMSRLHHARRNLQRALIRMGVVEDSYDA